MNKKDFYGQEIIELQMSNGKRAQLGDVIRWPVWDSDDNTQWTFTGIYQSSHVIYLGGGIDFGLAIGNRLEIEEVISQSEDNDLPYIDYVGSVADINRVIAEFKV